MKIVPVILSGGWYTPLTITLSRKKCSLSSFLLNMQSILELLCMAVILMSFLGLFEGGFTKVFPLTILLFIFIFIDHNNYKDLDFKLKRATT